VPLTPDVCAPGGMTPEETMLIPEAAENDTIAWESGPAGIEKAMAAADDLFPDVPCARAGDTVPALPSTAAAPTNAAQMCLPASHARNFPHVILTQLLRNTPTRSNERHTPVTNGETRFLTARVNKSAVTIRPRAAA